MSTKPFSIRESFSEAWQITRPHLWFLICAMLISCLASGIPALLQHKLMSVRPILGITIWLTGWILQTVIMAGMISIALRLTSRKSASLGNLLDGFDVFFKFLLGSLWYAVVGCLGLVLLIVPGVIWFLTFQFFPYALVERNTSIGESFRFSRSITRGHRLQLLLFLLTLIGVNVLGALALVVGLLVTIPLSTLATTVVYRKLSLLSKENVDLLPEATPFEPLSDGNGI